MNKIEHIGIAVKDIEASNNLFSKILNTQPYKSEMVESEGVITSFFMVGETKIELLQATHSESAIAKFIDKKGEGIHHIAFGVDDVESDIKRLQIEGIEMIHQKGKSGADNKTIAFAHPKSTNGVLIEICSDTNDKQLI
ncbi:MAG: methylmalonyl-CoA epimerase [Bacteroidota bacterium]|nr:methylmalonyl-CoA epimerase [Bacteroidota bacterium]